MRCSPRALGARRDRPVDHSEKRRTRRRGAFIDLGRYGGMEALATDTSELRSVLEARGVKSPPSSCVFHLR